MIISDLEHLEVVREENQIEGGIARADSFVVGVAIGDDVAVVDTFNAAGALDDFGITAAGAISSVTAIAA